MQREWSKYVGNAAALRNVSMNTKRDVEHILIRNI